MGHQHSNRSVSNRSSGIGLVNTDTPSVSPNASDENLVTVKIRPNAEGQFGFNVSGGADHKKPVVVSRVGEKMPASTCYPRLHVGDQIVRINDRDISDYTQEQVSYVLKSISGISKHDAELIYAIDGILLEDIWLEWDSLHLRTLTVSYRPG